MSDLEILIQTINQLEVENADPELCVSYTEMDILIQAKDFLGLESEIVSDESVINEQVIEQEYTQITYKGFKIRAQE